LAIHAHSGLERKDWNRGQLLQNLQQLRQTGKPVSQSAIHYRSDFGWLECPGFSDISFAEPGKSNVQKMHKWLLPGQCSCIEFKKFIRL
jgi:hypothetical protein